MKMRRATTSIFQLPTTCRHNAHLAHKSVQIVALVESHLSTRAVVFILKYEAGASTTELAAEFSVTSQCVRNTLRRYSKTGSNASRPRAGRHPILSIRDSRTLYRHVPKAPKITYDSLIKEAHLQQDYSHSTAYRALRNQSLTNFRASRQPRITASNAQKRLQFCREYTDFNWRRVTFRFSD
jgi:transposase